MINHMLYYIQKGNQRSGYPQMTKLQPYVGLAVTIAVVAAISFP